MVKAKCPRAWRQSRHHNRLNTACERELDEIALGELKRHVACAAAWYRRGNSPIFITIIFVVGISSGVGMA